MSASRPKSDINLGFLTVLDEAELGLLGGYLVLNPAGRPLEFQCTAPIRPTRAQQILYGTTLQPYLYGEQIGRTLVDRSKREPAVVFTDQQAALTLRDFIASPVTLVLDQENHDREPEDIPRGDCTSPTSGGEASQAPNRTWRVDTAHREDGSLVRFRLGSNLLAVTGHHPDDRQTVDQRMASLAETFDLGEPFQRIREAIEEARRGG